MWQIKFSGKLPSANRTFNKFDWMKRKKLNDKNTASILALYHKDNPLLTLPLTIHLKRIAPRKIDSDNLQFAFKNIRDTITQLIFPGNRKGIGDDSPEITFLYSQEKGQPKEYAISITINPRNQNANPNPI